MRQSFDIEEMQTIESRSSASPHQSGTVDPRADNQPDSPSTGYLTAPSDLTTGPVPSAASDETDDASATISVNSDLLSFQPEEELESAILDSHSQEMYPLSLVGRLHGMFSLAGDAIVSSSEELALSSPKLACYRRNLFQVSGRLTISKDACYVLAGDGQQSQISRLELTLTGVDSAENEEIKLINIPGKNAMYPSKSPEGPAQEPQAVPVDLANGRGVEPGSIDVDFHWKRLQFRHATANNGRRKELQQTFSLSVNLVAHLASQETATLVRIQTHGLIVRGRSPSNFQSRKDRPICGSGHHARKVISAPSLWRASTARAGANTTGRARKRKYGQQSRVSDLIGLGISNDPTAPTSASWRAGPSEPGFSPRSNHAAASSSPAAHPQSRPPSNYDGRFAQTSTPHHPGQSSNMYAPVWTAGEMASMQPTARQEQQATASGLAMPSPSMTNRSVPTTQSQAASINYAPQQPNPSNAPLSSGQQPYSMQPGMVPSPNLSTDSMYNYFPLQVEGMTTQWMTNQQMYDAQHQQQQQHVQPAQWSTHPNSRDAYRQWRHDSHSRPSSDGDGKRRPS